jgi:hypothetical protein
MFHAMRIMESIGLMIKKPMSLTIDNNGAVDYTNGWSVGGRMKQACIRLGFLRDMKEQGLLDVNW